MGAGLGVTCGALLARYGRKVLICESHTIPGGVAHSFERGGFQFDSGPSFYCGLSDPTSLNPLTQVLHALGETIPAVPYSPFAHYHFPEQTFPVYGPLSQYRAEVARITPGGARELQGYFEQMLRIYEALAGIPVISLRGDWQLIPQLMQRYGTDLIKFLPILHDLQTSAGAILERYVRDPWVRQLMDLECFLLSGLTAGGTIAPEIAFMLGERNRSVVDYPVGGSGAIIQALVRGLQRWGGELRLGTPVAQILVKHNQVQGIQLSNGQTILAPVVISNATLWDTVHRLLPPESLPPSYRREALSTPALDSFMHLHLGIKSEGLEHLMGHHAVVHNSSLPLNQPGNTCMISIPSVWDAALAPPGHHVVHAYTMESFAGWERNATYNQRKQQRVQPLYQALAKIIPDLSQRVVLELIGTPLTHSRFARRHQGTYGPGVIAGKGFFPGHSTPINGLHRVGDSTLPGIGVPAVCASGILCANSLR